MTTPFELEVLGSAGSHTGPGRVCSGYLLRAGATRVLVDAGNGSTANLQRSTAFADLDAVCISHRHIDHCADLIGMFYALRFDPRLDRGDEDRVDLYAPDEVVETLTGLLSSDSAMAFTDVFAPHRVAGGDVVRIGPMEVAFHDALHPPPSVSMRFRVGDRVLAYSGDTAGGEALVACARDADLLLCEATWQGSADDYPSGVHLVAADAGRIAEQAGVGRLVLTHIAGGLDTAVSRAEASATFSGPVEVAEDGATFDLT